MSPASTKFEIPSTSGPRIQTSLGSCALKITGETPKSPENLTASLQFAIPTPSVSGCTAGTSTTLAGEWKAFASGTIFMLTSSAGAEGVTMRFTSLPSCKLTILSPFTAVWSNGVASPALKSGYSAFTTRPATWANDGGGCALAGKTEPISYYSGTNNATLQAVSTVSVNNLTSASTPIIVGN